MDSSELAELAKRAQWYAKLLAALALRNRKPGEPVVVEFTAEEIRAASGNANITVDESGSVVLTISGADESG